MVSNKSLRYKRLSGYGDHDDDDEPAPWFRIKFKKYALFMCSLPCLAFTFCVVYSLAYDFHSSTVTTCGAYNILPSISSAIGGYSPQKEVWKAAISITFLPRVLLIRDYVQYHLNVCQSHSWLILVLAILNFVENCALMSLSFYDSTNYYSMHEKSFITFIITSELYMMLLIYLNSTYKLNASERHGLKLKKLLAITNVCGILMAMYYFIDHNLHCKNFTYSKFAFCEYVVVFSNIAFHTTIIYDFPNRYVTISPQYLVKIEASNARRKLPLVNI